MNFIIAVVNQSYESCMNKMKASSYLVKLEMISEREAIMSNAHLDDPDCFPNFIVLRKEANSDIDQSSTEQEWLGVVKEIKNSNQKTIELLKKHSQSV